MTLLTIVQDAARYVGFDVPNSVVANTTDTTAQQMWAICNRLGKHLAEKFPWQVLIKEQPISISEGVPDYAVAADFSRLIDETIWNRTADTQVFSPVSGTDWHAIKGAPVVSATTMRVRLRNNRIEFADDISASQAGQEVYYGYISKYWCQSSGGAGQSAFAADSDVLLLDEELLTLGLIYRFLRAKGQPFEGEMAEYDDRYKLLTGSDQPAKTIRAIEDSRTLKQKILDSMPDTDYGQ